MKIQIIEEDYENSCYDDGEYSHREAKIKLTTFDSISEFLESQQVKDFFGIEKGYDRFSTWEAGEYVKRLIQDSACQELLTQEGFVNKTRREKLEKGAKFTGRLFYQDWMGHLVSLTCNTRAMRYSLSDDGKPLIILAEILPDVIKEIDEEVYKEFKKMLASIEKKKKEKEAKKAATAEKRKAREIAKAKKLLEKEGIIK